MGGSLGFSKNKSRSGFQQDVWEPQGEFLQGLYGAAQGLFGGNQANMQGQMDTGRQYGQDVMSRSMPAFQQQLEGGAFGGMDLQKQLMQSLKQSQQGPSAMQDINTMIMGGEGNTSADAMKAQYMQDAQQAQDQMLGGLDARAAASGMSGGARHGVAQAKGLGDISQNLQGQLARTGYETFDKDLQRKMDIARQADVGSLERQKLMSGMIGGQQAAMAGGLDRGQQLYGMGRSEQMMPWEQMGQYSNVIGGPTVLGGGASHGSGMGVSGSGGIAGGK